MPGPILSNRTDNHEGALLLLYRGEGSRSLAKKTREIKVAHATLFDMPSKEEEEEKSCQKVTFIYRNCVVPVSHVKNQNIATTVQCNLPPFPRCDNNEQGLKNALHIPPKNVIKYGPIQISDYLS